MKNQRGLSTIIILFIGIVIGIAILIAIGAILSYVYPLTEITDQPMTFGDIKVWAQKHKDPEDIEVPKGLLPECTKELWMTKDDVPFLLITHDKAGKVNSLFLVKNWYRPVFWMEPLGSPGKWGNAIYSCFRFKEKPSGESFKDINFDGRFDFKITFDEDPNKISPFIWFDESWHRTDNFSNKKMEARIGETKYTFDPNAGCWQIDQ